MEPKDNTDKGTFIREEELGPELTEENCTPELWEELNGDDDPFTQTDNNERDAQ